VSPAPGRLLRVAGAAFLILAALMFFGSFIAADNTPIGRDLSGCRAAVPCDPSSDPSRRQSVFFLGMGATLIACTGGIVLRTVGRWSAFEHPRNEASS
jgi:hypothetical protein